MATGSAISTTAGYHTFTVTALDNRGNPTKITVGYFARTSNTPTVTTSGAVNVAYTSSASNTDCSLGDNYTKYSLLNSGTSTVCPAWGGPSTPTTPQRPGR